VGGSPPFYELAALGGPYQMRGYYEGRYRDKAYATAQMEYRMFIFRRIGLVAFGGLGDVSDSFPDFELEDFKYSYGFGIRFTIDVIEKLNVRMDIGLGKNTKGVYFAVEEAF
jgi:outer membrane protein assembly factor BamA